MNELAVLNLSFEEMEKVIPTLTDEELDYGIAVTEDMVVANRLMRVERGRRTEKLPTGGAAHLSVTGGVTLTQHARNQRSQERIVAEYDPTSEEVKSYGWDKLVAKARGLRRESTVADPSAMADLNPDDVKLDNGSLLFGDFRERLLDLPDGSVDLIVTDPPYPEEDLPLWSDLAFHAKRLLGPRGILFAMTGQIYLPEVLDRLGEHLNYGWIYNYEMSSGRQSRIMGRHIIQTWKPILAYTVGAFPSGEWGKDTLVSTHAEKDDYEWQQTEGVLTELIDRHSAAGGLVVDPFLGVGTYGVDATRAGRRFIGVEIDAGRFNQAKERLTG